ncbi:unnamed protein product [Discula destructiva]
MDFQSADNPRFSFGVELEFLVAYVPENARADATDPDASRAIQGVDVHNVVFNAIQALPGVGGEGGANRVFDSGEAAAWGWSVDMSIRLPDGLDHRAAGTTYRGVYWTAMEVQSPALWADQPESWNEVRQVCELLTNQFFTITPHCTGLHWHVGTGAEYMSVGNLRRIASVLFASDTTLAQLHPAHRRTRKYCLPNRLFSWVAAGRNANSFDRDLQIMVGDPEEAPQQLHAPVGNTDNSTFTRQVHRGTLTGYQLNPDGSWPVGLATIHAGIPRDTRTCLGEIAHASRRGVIALLMENSLLGGGLRGQRLAYNFNNLHESVLRPPHDRKRTIEFRQAAGSTNPVEVLAFGKLYVGLCQFAIALPQQLFWPLLDEIIESSADPENSDVFDLLEMMGLYSEATELQRVILGRPAGQIEDYGSLVGRPAIVFPVEEEHGEFLFGDQGPFEADAFLREAFPERFDDFAF